MAPLLVDQLVGEDGVKLQPECLSARNQIVLCQRVSVVPVFPIGDDTGGIALHVRDPGSR